MLARRGCLAYANEMVKLLPTGEIKIYASRESEEPLPDGSYLIPTFKNKWEFIWRTLRTLPNFLWQIRWDFQQGYQIFYFPVFHHWNPVILLLAKWLGAKTILTIHDAVFHPGEWQWGQGWFQNRAMRRANRLIVLSEFVKKQLPVSLQGKTTVIPHPVLLPQTTVPRRVFKLPLRLLFLGRMARYKGVDLLLEAVKDFSAEKIQHLTLAGLPMQETVLPETAFPIQKIERWLNESEITPLLQEHDVLILPYREASQSGVVALGIPAAIPMVVTKVGGLPEQLAEKEAVWVEPTVHSIRAGIVQLLENPNLYENLHQQLLQKQVKAGTNLIRERFEACIGEL